MKEMDNNMTTNEQTPKPVKQATKKKNGLPWWGWLAVICLPVIGLFSLTMFFGEPPEQSRYANKNKTTANINPKNNPQKNVKPKTNVANLNGNKNNQPAASKPPNTKPKNAKPNNTKPNNANRPSNTAPLNNKNTATKTNNQPKNAQNNQSALTQLKNGIPADALAIQNRANSRTNANKNLSDNKANTNSQNLKNQNKAKQAKPKPVKSTQQQQPNNKVSDIKNTNNKATAQNPTPSNRNTSNAVNSSNIKSQYKGSASKVDIAAQTNATQIINFGTVTNDDKLLTPSAYSNFIKISKILQNNPKTTIALRTHNRNFNNSTNNEKAKQQGKVRASLLKKVLVDSGVNANRISIELIGHIEPLIEQDPSHTRNRRVSVKIN